MPTVTIYSDASDGGVYSSTSNSTYADARSGTGTATLDADSTNTTFLVGQLYWEPPPYNYPTYACHQGFVSFPTSTILSLWTITDLNLSLYCNTDNSTADFQTEVRVYDFGGSVSTADYRAGSSLSGYTKVATFDSAGVSTSAYSNFTKLDALFSNINLSGNTRFILCSKEQTDDSAPTTGEYLTWYASEQSGTTQDPKLTISYTSTAIKKVAGVVYA